VVEAVRIGRTLLADESLKKVDLDGLRPEEVAARQDGIRSNLAVDELAHGAVSLSAKPSVKLQPSIDGWSLIF